MKKLFLSVIAIVAISASSVFATAYDAYEISQLVDENTLKADLGGSIGVLFGTESLRFAVALNDGFGATFRNVQDWDDNDAKDKDTKYMTDNSMFGNAYVGLGYKTPVFGAWIGYQIDAFNDTTTADADDSLYIVHTPHLQFTALDDNLRINIPVSIGTFVKKTGEKATDEKIGFENEGVVALSTDVQIRYYTPIDYFTAVRLYVRYGMVDALGAKALEDTSDDDIEKLHERNQSSFGIEARFYFDVPNDSPVTIAPWVSFAFDTALGETDAKLNKGQYNTRINALKMSDYTKAMATATDSPSQFEVTLNLDLTAGNDIVTFLGSPYLLSSSSFGKTHDGTDAVYSDKGLTETDLYIGAYMELYVTPVPELELYVELDTAYNVNGDTPGALKGDDFSFASGTGVRWYF